MTYDVNVTLSLDASHARGEISRLRLPTASYSERLVIVRVASNGAMAFVRCPRWSYS